MIRGSSGENSRIVACGILWDFPARGLCNEHGSLKRMVIETLLSVDEFLDLPDVAGVDHELIRGRVVEMCAPAIVHSETQAQTTIALGNVVNASFPHFRIGTHGGFIVAADSALAPDVFLVDRARSKTMEIYRGAFRGAPDLAVEIISPSESAADSHEKVELYLAAGTRTVWQVFPNTRHVLIYHSSGDVRRAGIGQTLDAPDVLPGVAIPVASIFPAL